MIPIILAAGASTRMGRSKALLDFDGRTALERVLETYAGLAPVVVLGPDHADVRARVDLSGIRVALNPDPASGQTESLKAGLRLLPAGEDFLFQPVDFVLIRPAELRRLIEAFRDPAVSVCVPSHARRRGHPVLCRAPIADELLALPAGASAREVLFAHSDRVRHVEEPSPRVVMDMDTPADYARCLEVFRAP